MIERTQKRLREAQFFYRRLDSSKDLLGRDKDEPEAFEFYLSAFIQVARTVPWVLQSEEKEKYDAWNPIWEQQLSSEEHELLKFTKKIRNEAVKRGVIETVAEWENIDLYELLKVSKPSIESMIFDVTRQHPAYGVHRSWLPGTEPPSVNLVRRIFHFERKGVKEGVTATCRRYLDYLEKLVREFEQAHKQNDSSDIPKT